MSFRGGIMPAVESSSAATDIPSVELRIRGFFNDKQPADMHRLLADFLKITGLKNGDDIFTKGMYLAQHPEAFGNPEAFVNPEAFGNPEGLGSCHAEPGLVLDNTGDDSEAKMLALDADLDKPVPAERQSRIPRPSGPSFEKWKDLPAPLWQLVFVCALGATVQGFDESAVNGAQILYQTAFGIKLNDCPQDDGLEYRPDIVGLVNAAPYLCCVISCWFTPLLNAWLGRRGTILLCALFSIFFAFAQAFAQSWQELFAYRLLLGVGIGPKSATIPIYAAESAPANIRGSLVMCWQAFTALGIALGCIFSVVFHLWGDISNRDICPSPTTADAISTQRQALLAWNCSWNWRIILASPMVLPVVLAFLIYFCRESPRWTVAYAHRLLQDKQPKRASKYYKKAFRDLEALSRDRLLAARDMFSHFYLLQQERDEMSAARDNPHRSWLTHKFSQLFGQRRTGRAIAASLVCMFAQQFCGVNVLIYYSNYVLERSMLGGECLVKTAERALEVNRAALLHTMGFGLINLFFALPAFFLIDHLGRRTLLLLTFPILAIAHVITATAFPPKSNPDGQPDLRQFLAGYYLFGIFYSFGEGPVPFVYASESMPLFVRDESMGFVTSVNWLFNWLVAFTAPFLFGSEHGFGSGGTFAFYAVCCLFLWFLILLLVPETRLLTLEQLDRVFHDMGFRDFARHAIRSLLWRLALIEKPDNLYESRGQKFFHGKGFRRYAAHAVRRRLCRFGIMEAPPNSSSNSILGDDNTLKPHPPYDEGGHEMRGIGSVNSTPRPRSQRHPSQGPNEDEILPT